EWKALHMNVRNLTLQNSNQLAFNLSTTTARSLSDSCENLMNGIISANTEQMNQDKIKSDQDYQNAFILMVSLVVIGILIGIIVGWLISNSISKGVARIVVAAKAIADGDLTQNVTASSKAEIGELANI